MVPCMVHKLLYMKSPLGPYFAWVKDLIDKKYENMKNSKIEEKS